ncbi:MAG: HDOD domain-containing protein [Acidihalobacter sp.]
MRSARAPQTTTIDVADLPTSTRLVFQVLDACETADGSMADIANIIRQDAALASRVLALSAGRAPRPVSLERSLALLGIDALKTLALSTAVYPSVDNSFATPGDVLRRFRRESQLTATLAERLAELSGYTAGDEAYLAGLLSNIGQMGLLARAPGDYAPLFEQASAPDELLRRETAAFGVDHAALGATMLQKAGYTGPLTHAVRYHHAAPDSLTNAHHLVRLAAVASRLAGTGRAAASAGTRLLDIAPGLLDEAYAAATERTERASCGSDLAGEAFHSPQAWPAAPPALARKLGDLQLISAVHRQLADCHDVEGLCNTAQLAASLLFRVRTSGFVLMQSGGTGAIGYSATDPNGSWPELVLRLPDEQSRVGSAMSIGVQQEHYPWREGVGEVTAPAIVDLEFAALLKCEGFLALPLVCREQRRGVMLLGVDPQDETRLTERRSLVTQFARELGSALAGIDLRNAQHGSALTEQAAELHLRTRSIAHEVRTPLSIIQNRLHILGKQAAAGSAHPANDIRIITEEISRIGTLVGTLTDTPNAGGRDETARVNELIEDVARLVKAPLIMPAQIELELSLDDSIPEIAVPRNSVKQILLNLVKNAAEVLSAGQCISIHSEDYVYNGKTPYVSIGVTDDGPGIPPQVLAAIFEPVASGKGDGHSGLGLSITKQLVDSLDGHITCRSSARGTRFQVLLPRILPGTRDTDAKAAALPPNQLLRYAQTAVSGWHKNTNNEQFTTDRPDRCGAKLKSSP